MQLPLNLKSKALKKHFNADLSLLENYLISQRHWANSTKINDAINLDPRRIRLLVTASKGHIISAPGTLGYKHIKCCTPDEVNEAKGKLLHMAKGIHTRVQEITKAFHESIHKPQ